MVAAKFLTSRFLNREAVARTFRQIWRSSNGFKIRHLGDHLAHFVPYQSTGNSVIFVPGYYERDPVHLQVNYSEEVDASAIRVEKVASTAVDSLDMETEDFGEGINDGNFLKKKKKS